MFTESPAAIFCADSLSLYTKTIRNFKSISQEEEISLITQFKETNDQASELLLIKAHLKFVVSIAYSLKGYGLPQMELIQEGNMGLMKAVKNFDFSRNVRLVTYALILIKSAMHEYIVRNCRMVKIATTHPQRKLFFNLRSMHHGLNALTTSQISAIAIKLDVKPEEVRLMENRLHNNEISIDSHSEDGSEVFSPIMHLKDGSLTPEESLELRQFESEKTIKLNYALGQLDDRSRRIIMTRWLDALECKTLVELADEFGISAERVRQLEGKALKRMKSSMKAAVN